MVFSLHRLPVSMGGALLGLPGLRGAWVAGDRDENGVIYDLTTQGRGMTKAGSPTFDHDDFISWVTLGTNNYFTRGDELGLRITGTETQNAAAARGMSLGGWFYLSTVAGFDIMISKWDGANQCSYALWHDSGAGAYKFSITTGGTAATQTDVSHTFTPTAGVWFFLAGTFDPSATMKIFYNNLIVVNNTAIPASIYSGTAPFEIGNAGSGTGAELDGNFAGGFLSDVLISESQIVNFYLQTRYLFGV